MPPKSEKKKIRYSKKEKKQIETFRNETKSLDDEISELNKTELQISDRLAEKKTQRLRIALKVFPYTYKSNIVRHRGFTEVEYALLKTSLKLRGATDTEFSQTDSTNVREDDFSEFLENELDEFDNRPPTPPNEPEQE